MEAVDTDLKSGSVIDQLLYGTDLPRFEHSDETAVLGLRQVDFLVVNILMAAGITVELVGRSPAVEGMEEHCPLYHAVQIIDNVEVDLQMQKTQLTQVKWVDKRDMLGLQVKLNGAHKWKVTIDSEARDQHVAAKPGRVRARSADRATDKKHVYYNHNLYEVTVPVEFSAQAMMCTTAVARGITINIAFKTKDDDGAEFSVWNKTNNLPHILQRRVDMMFCNRFITDVQVWFCSRTRDRTELELDLMGVLCALADGVVRGHRRRVLRPKERHAPN